MSPLTRCGRYVGHDEASTRLGLQRRVVIPGVVRGMDAAVEASRDGFTAAPGITTLR